MKTCEIIVTLKGVIKCGKRAKYRVEDKYCNNGVPNYLCEEHSVHYLRNKNEHVRVIRI